jgi:hypothetical protein
MFQHTKIYQRTKWIYVGEQTMIVIQMLRPFGKKEEAAGTLVTSKDLCVEPWPLCIQGEQLSSNVKVHMYNSIHDPEAAQTWGLRDLPDNEDIDVPARRQAAKISNIPWQIWVMKHRHGMTGTGKFIKLWGYR